MVDNIDFLLNRLYPEEKIIIWAHNSHTCHNGAAIPGGLANSTGKWIVRSHRPELYTIGLYMYRGKAATNGRVVCDVTRAMSDSIESVLYLTRREYCFVDMLEQTPNDGNSWMYESVYAKGWGTTNWPLVPRNQYDAILFIHTVSPPTYIAGGNLNNDFVIEPESAHLRPFVVIDAQWKVLSIVGYNKGEVE